MLVFEERGKAEYPEKKPLGANSTHIMASTPGFELVASVCTPLATRRLKTPNIVDPVRLYIVLDDNTDRVKEKFCPVMVVVV